MIFRKPNYRLPDISVLWTSLSILYCAAYSICSLVLFFDFRFFGFMRFFMVFFEFFEFFVFFILFVFCIFVFLSFQGFFGCMDSLFCTAAYSICSKVQFDCRSRFCCTFKNFSQDSMYYRVITELRKSFFKTQLTTYIPIAWVQCCVVLGRTVQFSSLGSLLTRSARLARYKTHQIKCKHISALVQHLDFQSSSNKRDQLTTYMKNGFADHHRLAKEYIS